MYNTLLFDLDGTLTDPWEGITNSVAYALAHYGIPVEDRRALTCFIGPPLHRSFQVFYGFGEAQSLEAVEVYREYYRDRGIWENRVYDGIPALLARLQGQGRRLVLATSKPEVFARQILEHFDLARYFTFLSGANLDGSRTDKGEVVAHALAHCPDWTGADTVMIGDREHDVLGARANGVDTIGVLFGYGSRAELTAAGAIALADTVAELDALVQAR